jgi:choline dehydrogenase-like flavoprotein
MRRAYDAVVVGSGATGGWAAKELSSAGLCVLVLEAGPLVPPPSRHLIPRPASKRHHIQVRCWMQKQFPGLFIDDLDNPYTTPENRPFTWIRNRVVGGRTTTWSRGCLRFSDFELKARSSQGIGEDWPIAYADLEPYYDRVEAFIGLAGDRDGRAEVPDSRVIAPGALGAAERRLKAEIEARWPDRTLIAKREASAVAPPGAPRCAGCAHHPILSRWPHWSSLGSTLHAAMSTGRVTLRDNTIVSHITVSPKTARATGLVYLDRTTRAIEEVSAGVVFVCASTIESTRILLNSVSPQHPNGLGNSSGLLGKNLMDHLLGVRILAVRRKTPAPRGERLAPGFVIPRFQNLGRRDAAFTGGYGLFGQLLKHPLLSLRHGAWDAEFLWLATFGEMVPRATNTVTLHPTQKDAWGLPVPHIQCVYSDNERAMAAHALEALREIAAASGFRILEEKSEPPPPGSAIHEVGTARMGSDPRTSVQNPFAQCWDAPNVLVPDGSAFVTSPYQNPTLTMMAITVRACDRVISGLPAESGNGSIERDVPVC